MGELYRLDFASGKSYIGISTISAKARFAAHAVDSRKKQERPIYRAWKKHGKPVLVILAVVENHLLAEAEKKAVSVFKTMIPYGYNSTEGGDTSPMLRPEIAAKVSAAMKGKTWSDERKAKHSASLIGNQRLKGHTHSEESRMKMSAARKGIKFNDPDRSRRLSLALKGKKRSEETKALNSTAAKGWMDKRRADDPIWWANYVNKRNESIRAAWAAKKGQQ